MPNESFPRPNGRLIFGRAPRAYVGENQGGIHRLFNPYFKIKYTQSAFRTMNPNPESPSERIEFEDGHMYIGYHVTMAPRIGRDGNEYVQMGYFAKYRRYGHKWIRPSSSRSKQSENVIYFRFGNNTKAIYYPCHKTLICCSMGFDFRSIRNLEKIHQHLLERVGISERPPEDDLSEVARTYNLQVGADPEFEIMGADDNIISPNVSLFPNRTNAPIGLDGAGQQIEFRPTPGTPEHVVSDIRMLMRTVRHRLCTLGNTYAIGGHIHLGYGFQYDPPLELVWLLDQYLGLPTIDLSGNARSYYKRLGTIETKQHGFEYRACPAAIFDSPRFAELSMKIAKNVCDRYANKKSFFIRNNGVGRNEYVDYNILTNDEYDEWVKLLTSYPVDIATPNYDCRLNWSDAGSLQPPHEGVLSVEARNHAALERARIAREHEWQVLRQREEMRAEQSRAIRARSNAEICLQLDFMGVQMNDEWTPEVMVAFRDEIVAHTTPDERTRFFVFGLANTRGMVTWGYNINHCRRLTSNEGRSWSGGYGIPWAVRNGQFSNDIVRCHARAILLQLGNISEDEVNDGTGPWETTGGSEATPTPIPAWFNEPSVSGSNQHIILDQTEAPERDRIEAEADNFTRDAGDIETLPNSYSENYDSNRMVSAGAVEIYLSRNANIASRMADGNDDVFTRWETYDDYFTYITRNYWNGEITLARCIGRLQMRREWDHLIPLTSQEMFLEVAARMVMYDNETEAEDER